VYGKQVAESERDGKREVYVLFDEIANEVRELGEMLRTAGRRCATAESCTGGMLGAALTHVPGSSDWFAGGVIAYNNQVKINVLRVRKADLLRHGAVSEEVARQMALGAALLLEADLAVALSGIAGPQGGSPDKPVGTVCIGWTLRGKAGARTFRVSSDRHTVRCAAVREAIACMRRILEEALPPQTPPAQG
jgi:nicotinamide-nucleotide amidase